MKYALSEKDIASINNGLNARGKTEVVVSAKNGQIDVVLHEKKKIN